MNMDLKDYQKFDESARDMEEPIKGCLTTVAFFVAAIIICSIISLCSHG